MQANLIDKKFRKPNLPNLYDTEEDALAKDAEFRELVENIVLGRRALRAHLLTLPLVATADYIPRQLQT